MMFGRTCLETTCLKSFLFLLRPVMLLAFVTETDGNQSSRIVPHTDTHLVFSSPCRGKQVDAATVWMSLTSSLVQVTTSGELCVGCAEAILLPLLGSEEVLGVGVRAGAHLGGSVRAGFGLLSGERLVRAPAE